MEAFMRNLGHGLCIDLFKYYRSNKLLINEDGKIRYRIDKAFSFLFIYKSFLPYLSLISNGALKLYLYFGINCDYKNGYLSTSMNKLSLSLAVKVVTLRRWIKELQHLNLVYCQRQISGELSVQITPYGYEKEKKVSSTQLSNNYTQWVRNQKTKVNNKLDDPFFIITPEIINMWDEINNIGALKLYLYCGLTMNKETGFTYRSLPTIGKDLSCCKKTLTEWFTDLESIGLIYRHKRGRNLSCCTHVLFPGQVKAR